MPIVSIALLVLILILLPAQKKNNQDMIGVLVDDYIFTQIL
jgi:hypothetical protein